MARAARLTAGAIAIFFAAAVFGQGQSPSPDAPRNEEASKPGSPFEAIGRALKGLFGGGDSNTPSDTDPAAGKPDAQSGASPAANPATDSIAFVYIESELLLELAADAGYFRDILVSGWSIASRAQYASRRPQRVIWTAGSSTPISVDMPTDICPPSSVEFLSHDSANAKAVPHGKGTIFFAPIASRSKTRLDKISWARSPSARPFREHRFEAPFVDLQVAGTYSLGAFRVTNMSQLKEAGGRRVIDIGEGCDFKLRPQNCRLPDEAKQVRLLRLDSPDERELLLKIREHERDWAGLIDKRVAELTGARERTTETSALKPPVDSQSVQRQSGTQPRLGTPRTPEELAAMFNRGNKEEIEQFTQQLKGGSAQAPRPELQMSPGTTGQAFPARPVQLVVPFAPGGTTDVIARLVAKELSTSRGWVIVVENRIGESGALGLKFVASAAPDGHVVLFSTTAPIIFDSSAAAQNAQIVPVSLVALIPHVLVVNPANGPASVPQLVETGRQRPLGFAVAASTGESHAYLTLLTRQTGVQVTAVQHPGAGPGISALMAGRVDGMFVPWAAVRPMVSSEKLRVLGIASSRRLSGDPGVPTLSEVGIPGFNLTSWLGAFAPAGTPQHIVDQIEGAIQAAVSAPGVRDRLIGMGIEPAGRSSAEFAVLLRSDMQLAASLTDSVRTSAGPAAQSTDVPSAQPPAASRPRFEMPRTPQEMAAMFNRGNKEELDQFTQQLKGGSTSPPEPRSAPPQRESAGPTVSAPPTASADDDFRKRRLAAAQTPSSTPGASPAPSTGSARDIHARGLLYARQGQFPQAIEEFTKAIAADPKYGRAYMNRAIAHARAGNSDKASADFAHCCNIGFQEGCKASIQWVTGGKMGGTLQFSAD